MLVAPKGIINPCLRGYYWSWYNILWPFRCLKSFLRPKILATCRELHEIGTPVLYGYNTFRLVNRLFRTGLESCLNEFDDIHDFFAFEHRVSMTGANGYSCVTMPRFKMIRHLMVQNSDLDHDDLFDELIDPDLSSRLFNLPMKVENLYIRGIEPLKQDNQINPVAEEVINWLFETEIEPQRSDFLGTIQRAENKRIWHCNCKGGVEGNQG
jgi:hypothetical protein